MKFAVNTFPPSRSAGVRALSILAEKLRECGHEAETCMVGLGDPDAINIYPEIVSGNPRGARRVVRWVLGFPRLPIGAGDDDLWVTWSPNYWPAWAPRLQVDIISPKHFYPKTKPGTGTLLWVYKGEPDLTWYHNDGRELTMADDLSPAELGDVLRGADLLYSCDPYSALNTQAAICGTPVLFSPTAARRRAALGTDPLWSDWGFANHPDDLELARLLVWGAAGHHEMVRKEIAGDVENLVEMCERR
jgi:hypothetical protein